MTEVLPIERLLPRLLLVTRNLPPLLGGMERLNLHMAVELARKFDVDVMGPTGCREYLPMASCSEEAPHRPLWRFLPTALFRAAILALKRKPEWVLAGSGLTAPLALLAARLCGARAAVYVHGLDLVARHPVYRMIWIPCLRRMDLCVANSRHTAALALGIGISQARIEVVHPGVALARTPDPAKAVEFRERYAFGERKLLLSVGRMTRRKGLLEFVEKVLPSIVARHPDVTLLIIGDEAPDALAGSADGMGKRILQAASDAGVVNNVKIFGCCEESVLAAAYQAADVLVFPVREVRGDIEGFGMVAIEAAANGLPTIAFAIGGVTDAVADGVSGSLVPAGDYECFANRLVALLQRPRTEVERAECREFASAFAWDLFGEKLRSLFGSASDVARNR